MTFTVWDRDKNTIPDFAAHMADQPGALSLDWHYQKILAAIWLDELQVIGWTRDELREAAASHLWEGDTLPEVAPDEDGMTLGDWLHKRYPSAGADTITRMVEGYPAAELTAAELAAGLRIPAEHREVEAHEGSANKCIFLNGEVATLETKLEADDCVRVPAVPPFVTVLSFERMAKLPPSAYSEDKGLRQLFDRLQLETSAVDAWRKRLKKRSTAAEKKARPRTTNHEDRASRLRKNRALVKEILAKWPDERTRPSDREMARQLATGTRKAETIRKVIAESRILGKLGKTTQHN